MIDKLKRILSSDPGAALISVIIGVGFATLFRRACVGRTCKVYVPPAKDSVLGAPPQAWDDDACYTYTMKEVSCKKKAKHHIGGQNVPHNPLEQ